MLAGEQMGLVDRALGDYSPGAAVMRRRRRRLYLLIQADPPDSEVARCTATALWVPGGDATGRRRPRCRVGGRGDRPYRLLTGGAQVALLLGSAASGIGGESWQGCATGPRTTDLLLSGPALAHERMLDVLASGQLHLPRCAR